MQTLFFELIQVSIGKRDRLSRIPSEDEWKEMYRLANTQGIPAILFGGVKILPKEQLPVSDIIADWMTLCEKIEAVHEKQTRLAAFATKTFMSHGFRTIIIKGISLDRYYPKASLRYGSDIDIWIDGDRDKVIDYISSVKRPRSILYHHCDFSIIPDMNIEVHFTPSFLANPIHNRRFQRWARKNGERLFGNHDYTRDGYNIPDTSFNLPYLMTHLFRHMLDEELELKPFLDIYYILTAETLSEKDKHSYMSELREFGLDRFTAGVMYALGVACGLDTSLMLCEPDKKTGEAIIREIFKEESDKGILTKNKSNGNHIRRFLKREYKLMRFFRFYPSEIVWTPYWTIKIFLMIHRRKQ